MNEGAFRHRPGADADAVASELQADGWRVLRLPPGIADKAGFFAGVRDALPLDPPLATSPNWDALADSLWYGLHGLDADRIAILWPEASLMAEESPHDYDVAVALLTETATSLAVVPPTDRGPASIVVVRT